MENWQNIYNLSPGYLFSFNNSGILTRINSTLLAALGREHDEVVNKLKIEELLTPGTRIFFQTHLFPLIKMQGSAKELFLTLRAKDGSRVPALLNVLVEGNDEIFEVHCAGMEISNRNQFEKELFEAKTIAEKALQENEELARLKKELEQHHHLLEKQLREVSRFNYEHHQISKVLSHDLQEPLRKINMFISLIALQVGEGSPIYHNFAKIKKFTSRVRNLITSMQRFNSLDYEELNQTYVTINNIVRNAQQNAALNGTKLIFTGGDAIALHGDAPPPYKHV